MEILSIGQVARRAGVGVETVRFYEREGLLEEPPRRASGYRQYSEQVVTRLHFIKRAQQLGFSLKEISELLLLRVDAQTSCDEVKQRTEAKIAEVERKMVELQRMRQALLQVASLCTGQGPTGLLNPLFEARLQYQSDMEVVVSAETREGELVGSGDGRVSGTSLSGTARWSLYAGNCAYVFVRAGLEPPPGQHLCTVHPAGVIET